VTTALAAPALVPAPRPAGSVWWARITRRSLAPVEHSLVAVSSARFAAGTPVDLSALDARGRRPTGWLVDLRYRTADGAVVGIDIAGATLPLWFTEMHHGGAPIPAVTLAAHTGGDVPAGALVPPRDRGTRHGALRWQVRSGLVESMTVPPESPPCPIDAVLPVVADVLATLRGWPRPHGDLRPAAPATPRGVERLVGDLPARLI
jgi:hypothetical protein